MVRRYVRIGQISNAFIYDDGDYSAAMETDAPIKAGTPIDGNDVLRKDDLGVFVGDVVGPASSTDNAIVRFNGTTGKLVQNSIVTLSDLGRLVLLSGANEFLVFQGVIFTQISTVTIENTTTETTMIGSGVGTLTIPANFFISGRSLRIKFKGFVSGKVGDSSTLRVKLGSVTLVTSTATFGGTVTNVSYDVEYSLTCRTTGSTGTFMGQGRSLVAGGIGFATVTMRGLVMTSEATIDTTISNTIDFTYQWGAASTDDSVKITNLTIEVLN